MWLKSGTLLGDRSIFHYCRRPEIAIKALPSTEDSRGGINLTRTNHVVIRTLRVLF